MNQVNWQIQYFLSILTHTRDHSNEINVQESHHHGLGKNDPDALKSFAVLINNEALAKLSSMLEQPETLGTGFKNKHIELLISTAGIEPKMNIKSLAQKQKFSFF